MVMTNYSKILANFKGQPFRLKESREAGIPRSVIRGWLDDDIIERVAHGTYKSTNEEYDVETSYIEATAIVGKPSAVCLLSALEFYNLTDQIPKKTWVMVPADKKTTNSKIRLLRSRSPLWKIGIVKETGYQVTSIERTLVDCLLHRKLLGSSVVMEAIKEALNTKKTHLADIIKIAKKMKVYHRIELIIEALA
jgi:predicted transcriptional regulator of viral defense system